MARGTGCKDDGKTTLAAQARGTLSSQTETLPIAENPRFFVEKLWGRMERNLAATGIYDFSGALPEDFEHKLARARGDALGLLRSNEQRTLVQIIQDAEAIEKISFVDASGKDRFRYRFVSDDPTVKRAYDLLHICNGGFVEGKIGRYRNTGVELDSLRQACLEKMAKSVYSYRWDKGANFLTHLGWQFEDAITRHLQTENDGRTIRAAGRMSQAEVKVARIWRQYESEGRLNELTAEKLAEMTGLSEDVVADVIPHVQNGLLRLDGPASMGEEGDLTIGGSIADPFSDVEGEVVREAMRKAVHGAVAKLESPFQRRLLEMRYGLDGGQTVEKRELSNILYYDKDGNAYTSERKAVRRNADGETYFLDSGDAINLLSHAELRDRFAAGELEASPNTAEAAELMDLWIGWAEQNGLPRAPQTSVTIQEQLDKAESRLAHRLYSLRADHLYRGRDMLENSDFARELGRRALRARIKQMGGELLVPGIGERGEARKIRAEDVDKLAASRPAKEGVVNKGDLRIALEHVKVVNPEDGRFLIAPENMKLKRKAPEAAQAPVEQAAPKAERVSERAPRNPKRDKKVKTIDIVEMLNFGLVASSRVKATYQGQEWFGELQPDGKVIIDGESEAHTLGGAAHHLNGRWDSGYHFWRAADEHGEWRTLDKIRNGYLASQSNDS